jgi:hypothetical protein
MCGWDNRAGLLGVGLVLLLQPGLLILPSLAISGDSNAIGPAQCITSTVSVPRHMLSDSETALDVACSASDAVGVCGGVVSHTACHCSSNGI